MNAMQNDQAEQSAPRHARDVMTTKVITVGPEQLARDVAAVLLVWRGSTGGSSW